MSGISNTCSCTWHLTDVAGVNRGFCFRTALSKAFKQLQQMFEEAVSRAWSFKQKLHAGQLLLRRAHSFSGSVSNFCLHLTAIGSSCPSNGASFAWHAEVVRPHAGSRGKAAKADLNSCSLFLQAAALELHIMASFLNNSSSRWEAICESWGVKAELVDNISPIYRSDQQRCSPPCFSGCFMCSQVCSRS